MNNVKVAFVDMPCSVRGYVVRHFDDEVFYTIMLNSRMSADMQRQTYHHELKHIAGDDFSCDLDLGYIESVRHND